MIWSEPGCWIAEISTKRWGAATRHEVAARVDGAFPLPMGIEREDRCEQTGLQTKKGSMAPESCRIWSEPGGRIAQISDEQRGAATGDEVAVRVHGAFPLDCLWV